MSSFVVDTNVAIVANGDNQEVDCECQLNCVEKLEDLVKQGCVVVDEGGEIFEEYREYWEQGNIPGIGHVFFKHVWDNQHSPNGHVQRVVITPSDDTEKGFEELPKNDFDPSDRKFLAVAVKANAVVLNAVDSDWKEQAPLMRRLCVEVCQLCPQYASKRHSLKKVRSTMGRQI